MAIRVPTVDLSLDFDFFAREDPRWDWGHDDRNPLYDQVAWNLRYENQNLWEECAPARHADFLPGQLVAALLSKNVHFPPAARVGIADSHRYAYGFFREAPGGPPAFFLQLDAHHDCFGLLDHRGELGALTSGNWLQHLLHHWRGLPGSAVLQMYPKWKDSDEWGRANPTDDGRRPVEYHWSKWAGFANPVRVRNVFLCRSGTWVPPHLDAQFNELVRVLQATITAQQFKVLQPITKRTAPDSQANRYMVQQWQKKMEALRQGERELEDLL